MTFLAVMTACARANAAESQQIPWTSSLLLTASSAVSPGEPSRPQPIWAHRPALTPLAVRTFLAVWASSASSGDVGITQAVNSAKQPMRTNPFFNLLMRQLP